MQACGASHPLLTPRCEKHDCGVLKSKLVGRIHNTVCGDIRRNIRCFGKSAERLGLNQNLAVDLLSKLGVRNKQLGRQLIRSPFFRCIGAKRFRSNIWRRAQNQMSQLMRQSETLTSRGGTSVDANHRLDATDAPTFGAYQRSSDDVNAQLLGERLGAMRKCCRCRLNGRFPRYHSTSVFKGAIPSVDVGTLGVG